MSARDTSLAHFLEAAQPLTGWAWFDQAAAQVDALMAQDSGHDWGHLSRVLHNAHQLWRQQGQGSWPVIAAAVLMHDLVNLPKDSPSRHLASTMSAERALALLTPMGVFSSQELDLIAEAIRCHSYSSGLRAQSVEAQLVSDADRLDALGAVGAARTLAVGGALGRPLCHPGDPLARQRPIDDSVWSVDHFEAKLFKLPALMYTQAGLAMAQERVCFMRSLLERLEAEVRGQR